MRELSRLGVPGALALALFAGSSRAADDSLFTPANMPDFPPGPRPIEVTVGLTIVDFARVNARDESFDLHGYLVAHWRDPRMARASSDESHAVRRLKANVCWSPDYVFINSLENVAITSRSDIHVHDDGSAWQRSDFTGKFSTPMDLRRFPFDAQVLRLSFHVRNHDTTEVVLVVDPDQTRFLDEAFLSDWDIGGARAHVDVGRDHPEGMTFSRFTFETEIDRHPTFYVWRVLIPFTLLVAVTWMVFWFDVTGLQPQISTILAIMISVVVFNFTMDFSQPKFAYLTFVDRHAVSAFFFVFGSMLAVTVLHVVLDRRGLDAARRLQRVCRWTFPAAYLATVALEVALP